MKYNLLAIFTLFICTYSSGQVAVSHTAITPDPSAILEVNSNTKGLLIPRMTRSQRDAIASPAHALMIYQLDDISGFYYNNGTMAIPVWTLVGAKDCQGRTLIDALPYTISIPGSYYLASYLMGAAAQDGITITASNVTIDFNGYGIDGDSKAGNNGIVLMTGVQYVTIFNGTINSWGKDGMKGDNANHITLSNIKSRDNNYEGVALGHFAVIENCNANNNGFDGFDLGDNAVIHSSNADNNSSDGIELGDNATVSHCVSSNNSNNGFYLQDNTSTVNCIASNNGDNGISIAIGGVISDCSAKANVNSGFKTGDNAQIHDSSASNNTLHGFDLGASPNVYHNIATANTGHGFYSTASYGKIWNNHATNNNNGFHFSGSHVLITHNSAGSNTVNWNVSAGNLLGTILTSATINSNTNPNANITQ